MCKWAGSGFPGCQPVSMDLNNIALLQQKPYRVSWKADGTRYMMLIRRENEIYFFDRDNSCFEVEAIRFVCPEDRSKHLENTLLDGVSFMVKYCNINNSNIHGNNIKIQRIHYDFLGNGYRCCEW